MKKLFLIAIAAVAIVSSAGAQIVFSDDMSGTFGTNWTSQTTTVGVGSFSSGVLLLDNGVGAVAGQTWAYTATSSFSAPYDPILTNNTSSIQWALNMRTLTSDPSNSNRMAFVLAASSSDFSTANGYAVRVGGNSPSTDPFELIYFTGGVNGAITSIASGASFTANQFGDVRVVFDPSTDEWSLFGSTGASWGNPVLASTQLGLTTVNTTGVSTSLTNMGVWSLHTTGAAQDRSFDNLSVAFIGGPVPEPSTWAFLGLGSALMIPFLRRKFRFNS